MTIAPSTAAPAADSLLAALDPEQRAAATLPDGPAQLIASASSGKTTTLIARLGILLGRGVPADRIGVVTFNRDAAAEMAARIASHLAPHVPGAAAIEVRTLHAMARQVLLDAGRPVRLVADRLPLLRAARRRALAEPSTLTVTIPHPSLLIRPHSTVSSRPRRSNATLGRGERGPCLPGPHGSTGRRGSHRGSGARRSAMSAHRNRPTPAASGPGSWEGDLEQDPPRPSFDHRRPHTALGGLSPTAVSNLHTDYT